MSSPESESSWALFRLRDFRRYIIARTAGTLCLRMVQTIVGWQVYNITNEAISLGYVGLALFLPQIVLVLPAGDLSDRYDRRKVLTVGYLGLAVAVGILLLLTAANVDNAGFFYAALAVMSASLALVRPAEQSYTPFLAPRERLPHAIGFAVNSNYVGILVGPAAGGLLYLVDPLIVYGSTVALYCACALSYATFQPTLRPNSDGRGSDGGAPSQIGKWARLWEGLMFVRHRPLIIGPMTLDLFAVLLGGITALLPIFARDVLDVGPDGLGALRSMQALGGLVASLTLARTPIARHAGYTMFAGVAVYGLAIIGFALSTDFVLSLALMFVMGVFNLLSVSVRQTLTQLSTPDPMRGRVASVGSLLTGASNELGDFEAGVVAAYFGAVNATIIGGVGTLVIVALWMWGFPTLRRLDRMTDVKPG